MVIAYAAALWLIIYGIGGITEALTLRKINLELPDEFRTNSIKLLWTPIKDLTGKHP